MVKQLQAELEDGISGRLLFYRLNKASVRRKAGRSRKSERCNRAFDSYSNRRRSEPLPSSFSTSDGPGTRPALAPGQIRLLLIWLTGFWKYSGGWTCKAHKCRSEKGAAIRGKELPHRVHNGPIQFSSQILVEVATHGALFFPE